MKRGGMSTKIEKGKGCDRWLILFWEEVSAGRSRYVIDKIETPECDRIPLIP